MRGAFVILSINLLDAINRAMKFSSPEADIWIRELRVIDNSGKPSREWLVALRSLQITVAGLYKFSRSSPQVAVPLAWQMDDPDNLFNTDRRLPVYVFCHLLHRANVTFRLVSHDMRFFVYTSNGHKTVRIEFKAQDRLIVEPGFTVLKKDEPSDPDLTWDSKINPIHELEGWLDARYGVKAIYEDLELATAEV